MEETWKPVKGFEKEFMVSDLGKVKYVLNLADGTKRDVILKQGSTHHGYKTVRFAYDKKPYYLVHRLILESFVPNPENKPQINHINGIKQDNRLVNLEWCNASENANHAFKLGLRKPTSGEKHGAHKLTAEEVAFIRETCKKGRYRGDISEFAEIFKVSHSTISRILNREKWKCVS